MNTEQLIQACQQEWQGYIEHDFVHQLADSTLEHDVFLHYLKQDFLFLVQYSRAYALAIYKAKNLTQMRNALSSLHALLDAEIGHHVDFCAKWGISEQEMEAETEDFGTVAYTRYVLDTGSAGDLTDLYTALAPCAIGYGVIGKNLIGRESTKLEGNPYRSWLEMYSDQEFQQSVVECTANLDDLIKDIALDSARGKELIEIFRTATRMEIAFWEQGYNVLK
ncbi:putative TenA family transcriptional regulator [Vibrio halioticoli NBRC 102217]|uniref:Aminopyrimidine aminohydrolase n=1 Tax=Vibrio halioticoli NBRC 102217 TaxID=1219072 RepID=V5FL58_9VIBR|nr:thiaminase II [Vibrio halioticoli]GAD89627.1 putative TenA family transcriptional regulator [Vibrio halioticoli NBRC 102217]